MDQNSLVLSGKKELIWTKETLQPLKHNEILIKTIASAISIGAELPHYKGTDMTDISPQYPKETGYESYGEVVEIGSKVRSLNVGDRVVAFYGHKDYEIIQENKALAVPEDVHYSVGLLTILSCDAAKGVRKLNPNKTDKVFVTGMGTMGLLTVYFLKEYMKVGHVDVLEPNLFRGELAKKLGANHVFHNLSECANDFYEYGLECSGYNEAFQSLQKSLLKDGRICILSDGNKERFDLQPEFYQNELTIVGSSDGWDYQKHSEWFFEHVKQKDIPLSAIFELKIKKEELIQCFKDLGEGKISPLKVLVEY